MTFFSGKQRPGWLCLNMYAGHIDLSHVLMAGKERPEVLLCESFQKEGSDVDTLKRLRRDLNLDRYQCVTLLQSKDYQFFPVDTPNVPAEEARHAVRWSLKDVLDYPVEAATVDAVHVPGGGNSGRAAQMLAVAARNDRIAALVQPFNDAHIDLEVIDVPELAQRNLARLLETEGRGLALLAFDDHGVLLTFTSGGELYQARRMDVSLRDFSTAAQPDELYDSITLEMQRSMDHFDRQFRHVAVSKLVVSPVLDGERLAQYLKLNLTVPVELLEMEEVLDFPGVPELRDPLRQSQCLQMIGAALREERADR